MVWAKNYCADYPDQAIDITGLPSGTYRLTFIANPGWRWQELSFRNNVSWVLVSLDMENGTVAILREHPASPPPVEHIHLEQPFGIGAPTVEKPTEDDPEENVKTEIQMPKESGNPDYLKEPFKENEEI